MSDKIISSAVLGQRTEVAFYVETENLLYNPLLLLAARITSLFLRLDSNKEKLFVPNVAQIDLDGAYIPKYSLMVRLNVRCSIQSDLHCLWKALV